MAYSNETGSSHETGYSFHETSLPFLNMNTITTTTTVGSMTFTSSSSNSNLPVRTIPPPSVQQKEEILTKYSDEIMKMVNSGVYVKSKLESLPLSELGRLSWCDIKASQFITSNFGIYPLPLKPEINLYSHQNRCLSWLKERESRFIEGIRGGILNLTQGLGKTLTALSHLILKMSPNDNPSLVVCSKTVMSVWEEQTDEFFGNGIRVLLLHKDYTSHAASISKQEILSYHIVVTTWEVVRGAFNADIYGSAMFTRGGSGINILAINERKEHHIIPGTHFGYTLVHNIAWNRIVADESQKFRNPKTVTYKAMMCLIGKYKMCLTGTPICNKNTDIWSQFRWLGYKTITTPTEWSRRALHAYQNQQLDRCVLRIKYEDTDIKLPSRHIHVHETKLEKEQLDIYKMVLNLAQKAYNMHVRGLVKYSCILAIFTRLRQCCIAPYLMTPQAKRKKAGELRTTNKYEIELMNEIETMTEENQWVFNEKGTSGIKAVKVLNVLHILYEVPKGEKSIVFSKFTSALDIVEKSIATYLPNLKVIKVDGDVVGKERVRLLRLYRTDPTIDVIFISYDVGSEGLNLSIANHIIMIELWWTPVTHEQALRRAWRPGQTKEVHIHMLIVTPGDSKGIEQRIVDICDKKKEMASSFLDGGKSSGGGGLDRLTLGHILDMV